MYELGRYFANNPTWHEEDSAWKASHVLRILERNHLRPRSVGEVGCGAGAVLRSLHDSLSEPTLSGFDISPDAIRLASPKASPRLSFAVGDLFALGARFDVVIALDVFEHVEDCFEFLRDLRSVATHKVLHIPLEMSVLGVLRHLPERSREAVGHLHFFTKDTAFALLSDTGYEVVDWHYTSRSVDLPRSYRSWLALGPRRALHAIAPDWAPRLLGGFSVMVLAH